MEIAYLPQDSFLPRFITVEEVLREARIKQPFIFEHEKIKSIINQKVTDLSAEELRLIECVWVLNRKAKYALLDEPFSGLSPFIVEFLQQIITDASKTKGIILTDHIYRSLMDVSDRIVLLHNKSVYQIDCENDLATYNYIPGGYESFIHIPGRWFTDKLFGGIPWPLFARLKNGFRLLL